MSQAFEIQRDKFEIIEEVRAALMGFRDACHNMFTGQGSIEELDNYHAEEFINFFANANTNGEVYQNSRESQIHSFSSVGEMYAKRGGAPMVTPWHRILLRSSTEAVATFEIVMTGPVYWDRALCMQVWRKKEDGQWRIVRQLMEQEGRGKPTPEQLTIFELEQAKRELVEDFTLYSKVLRANAARNHGQRNVEIKHIEMRSTTEGFILSHVEELDSEGQQVSYSIKSELWTKAAGGWELKKHL